MADPLAYNQKDAAAMLGLSVAAFREHVRPNVGKVYVGRAVRFPRRELQAWIEREMA